MANSIINKPGGLIFSSAIGDINVLVPGKAVDVTLTDLYDRTLLSERLYPYGGKVTIRDLRSIIEDDMIALGYISRSYRLSVAAPLAATPDDSCIISALYCSKLMGDAAAATVLEGNFLSTLNVHRLCEGSPIWLSFFAQVDDPLEYEVAFSYTTRGDLRLRHARLTPNAGAVAAENGVQEIKIPYEDLLEWAESDSGVSLYDIRILAVNVASGERSAMFFYDPALDGADTFIFRNAFNVWERACLACVTTDKTKVDRSVAVVGSAGMLYDQTVTVDHEAETAALTSREARWIDELFSSHSVLRADAPGSGELYRVLITDSTCETSNGDDKLNTAKFTWRYADPRPVAVLDPDKGIFSTQYDRVFS